MKYFLSLIAILFINQLYAQNDAKIEGRVFDPSLQPLERATVSIIAEQDSLVLSYALTDGKGKFEFVRLPSEKPLILYVSHVNSASYAKKLILKPEEELMLDSIIMEGHMMEEVAITAAAPIRLNGDTLEYKADYFKTRPNASVEELLLLLPGLQVNADGSIYYQGKQVSGVRVNNKDFFAHDLTIATRNLDASLIDIVQVIKDKGESKREVLDDSELPIVLNLKMKKEFLKANFGKFYGSAATRDRYESGALLNAFRDTLQVSFIGFANNIGKQGFDYSELSRYGGFGRAENNRFVMYGSNGLMNQISAGINVNYDIAKKLKANLMYNYGQRNYYSDSRNNSQSFYNEIREESLSTNRSENDQFEHEIRGFVRYYFDTTAHFSFDGRVDLSNRRAVNEGSGESWRNIDEPVTNTQYQNNNDHINHGYRQTIRFEKKFENKWLLSYNHSLSNNQIGADNMSASLNRYYLFNDSLIDQENLRATTESIFNTTNKINLQIPISKSVNFDIFTEYSLKNESSKEDIQIRLNSDDFENRNDVANNKRLKNLFFYVGTQWNIKAIKNVPITVGARWLSLENKFDYYGRMDNRSNKHTYLLPRVDINFKGFRVSYSKQVNPPSFYQLVVVDSDLYPTSYTYASPYFDNVVEDQYSINYNKYFQKLKMSVYFYGRYSLSDHDVAQARTYDTENSFSTNRSYQVGATDAIHSSGNVSKTFLQNNTWKLSYSVNYYGSWSERYSNVNREENIADQFYGSVNNSINLSYKDIVTFRPNYGLQLNRTMFQIESENFRNTTNAEHSVGASLLFSNIKKFRLESSYTLKNQISGLNNERQNLHILNASIYYPVLQKGELKFTAFDILNQNASSYFSSYSNTTRYSTTLTLRQYFMLGFVYKFLTTGD